MGVKEVVMGVSVWVALNGACQAEPAITEGVIRFTGSIVEPGCRTDMNPDVAIELIECPHAARGTTLNVTHMGGQGSHTPGVSARLTADSGPDESYYNQRYTLVDAAGKPVLNGTWLVTLTTP
ncbi:type 1 fimbrial protein [Pseudomonas sp. B21-054]|uniref:type 1 fimbrial protein n=1 Tax=Pseudomonas sp. B21-054 TaxID=2895494 RepID=UPI00223231C2|nr:type 1 fimbrial protein [Pseudomonas sp. B21-054]UZE15977.1 type 1 fimbrial protein [Pseudomonas sp. B21-054]